MSRIARLILPGACHYVLCQAAKHHAPFRSPNACECYLGLLHEYAERTGLAVKAWCLLPSQVHLVVVPGRADSIGRTVRATHIAFDLAHPNGTAHGQRRWKDRPNVCALQAEFVPWAIHRVEHVPVRLGLVSSPEQHEWSSAGVTRPSIVTGSDSAAPTDGGAFSPTRHEHSLEFRFARCLQTGKPMGRDDFSRDVWTYTLDRRHCRTVASSSPWAEQTR